ncbi:nuclear transport factor 2 family protein [Cochleicola gelatinilyticus]|uniref:Limonene-1,2-epoxide hydrolase n=1 Tax=Cochleicola gelatinilyticus TaxID=1763537 RepID=A0A167HHX6_9FLAO|nr:nuclear transport factor 2 family protein [Cochleicola gelatinilyticus]OAB78622.1 limonene-1,2-epoxide hydrolase [Cochleicola gelatinilyticus]
MNHVIETFYEAFKHCDGETMAAQYHPEVTFHDPAFGTLQGEHAGNMWRMLTEKLKGADFTLAVSGIESDQETGKAHWDIVYPFSATGRKVHNKIDASFTFKDGKIFTHTDNFNLHTWARQALGIKGLILGGTGFFRRKLQHQTNSTLVQWELKQNEA